VVSRGGLVNRGIARGVWGEVGPHWERGGETGRAGSVDLGVLISMTDGELRSI
jgi:hypothetical protein